MMYMPEANKKKDHHQLSRIVLQVQQDNQIENTSKLLDKMILRRHSGIRDFKVLVPEMLIRQHQRAKNIFNFVLGAIAGISLLVGGIGIMNIMYASVLARMKEIGVRRAMGATRKDVMVQFISESILISISGGLVGVLLGIIISQLITQIAGISTIISIVSILTAFIVSICIGIIFGFSPARNAAFKNPIELLRYE
jgi:putative ABC transport system permease protein